MSEWQEIVIDELCSEITDCVNKTAPSVDYITPYKMIRTTNIKQGRINLEEVRYVTEETYNTWIRRGAPQVEDIILTREAPVGEVGMIRTTEKVFLGQRTMMYRTDHTKADPYFLYYAFQTDAVQEQIHSAGMGSVVEHVRVPDAKKFKINTPSVPEQKAIASVLSSLDNKIALLHRQNKTLEAMAETLFRQWFIEEAKEDWEGCILGDILEVLESGSRPKGGIDPELNLGVPSLGAESINGICNFDYSKVKYVTLEFADSCKKGHAQAWDILIYKDGAYVGKKALFGEKFPYQRFMINEHVFRLRSNTRCSQLYLYFALDSESLALLNSNSAQPGINQQSLKSYQITLPPKEKMEAFDSVVVPLTTKMNQNAIQISTCEKLRDTLLPKLMNGEVRVQYQSEQVA